MGLFWLLTRTMNQGVMLCHLGKWQLLYFPASPFSGVPLAFCEASAGHMKGRLWRNLSDLMAQLIILEVNPVPGNQSCFLCAYFGVQGMLHKLKVLLWQKLLKMHIMWTKTHRNDPMVHFMSVFSYGGQAPCPPKRHCSKNAVLQVDIILSKFLLLPFVH